MLAAFLIMAAAIIGIMAGAMIAGYRWGARDGAEAERSRAAITAARKDAHERWISSIMHDAARTCDWNAWLDELAPDETGPQQVIP